jgi:hypothetical protein
MLSGWKTPARQPSFSIRCLKNNYAREVIASVAVLETAENFV